MNYDMKDLCDDVYAEARRAVNLHRSLNSLHEAYGVIKEEFEEFWEEVKVNPKKLTFGQQEARVAHMKEELIQMAAMCVRTIHDCL